MCIGPSPPKRQAADPQGRAQAAAAEAAVEARRNATGYAASVGAGAPKTTPRLGTQILLGS